MAVNYRSKKFYNIGPAENVKKPFYFLSLSYPQILDLQWRNSTKNNMLCYVIEGSTKAYIE
jgi:hypothetical protein